MMARTPTASAAMMAAHPSGRIINPSMEMVAGQMASASLGAVPVAQAVAVGQPLPAGQVPMAMGEVLTGGRPVLTGQSVDQSF